MIHELIIIGAGPAGLTAGIYAGRAGVETLILESLFPGGQAATTYEVANYPGFLNVGGSELTEKMAAQAEACGAKTEFAAVTRAELTGDVKTIWAGDVKYEAKSVIVATGASKRELDIPGEKRLAGMGVSYCATCDGGFFRGKTVAVVGGGNTALEDALYLANLCEKVYLVHRRSEFRGVKSLEEQVRTNAKIELVLGYKPVSIEGEESVTGLQLETADGSARMLSTDGVFIAVGTVPATALVEGQLKLEGGYIAAGEDCLTDISGVFAAGDARLRPIKQIVTACADGAVAATAAAAWLQERR